MNGILGMAETLSRGPLDPDKKRQVGAIRAAGTLGFAALAQAIEALRDLPRPDVAGGTALMAKARRTVAACGPLPMANGP